MLPERIFTLGGYLSISLGGLMAAALAYGRLGLEALPFWFASAFLIGFGLFFIQVGRQAKQDRRLLLALGEKPLDDCGNPDEDRKA